MNKVYFLAIKDSHQADLAAAGRKIFQVFADFFNKKDKLAIKLHFGERGSKTYQSPVLVKAIYEALKPKVNQVVLCDCNVLYKGERSRGSTHKKLAQEQGFGFAPILIVDGEKGEEEMKVKIDGKHFKEVKIGGLLKGFNAILGLAHLTGHISTGFGGALKNIGMGLGSKGGKLEMHQAFKLTIDQQLCTGCGTCQRECPADAITLENGKAQIDFDRCIGCGRCIAACPQGAVVIPFQDGRTNALQERFVEYAAGALKGRKFFLCNVLVNITQRCDCLEGAQEPMMEDIGILASSDIVAIEQASLDLVGKKYFERPGIDPTVQINHAKEMGLGKKTYQLVRI